MNKTDENTTSSESKGPCGISSFLPLGMSCRGRAEAFARRLQSKLRTLGAQDSSATLPNETTSLSKSADNVLTNQLINHHESYNRTAEQQSNSCYDFEIQLASPASPTEEYDYRQLLNSVVSTTDTEVKLKRENVTDSEYVCSPMTKTSSPSTPCTSSTSSGAESIDGPYFDPESSDGDPKSHSLSLSIDFHDCVDSRLDMSDNVQNGRLYPIIDSDSCSESLPNSQSTTTSLSACTTPCSASNYTLKDETICDEILPNGHYSKDLQALEEFSETIYKRNLDLDTPFLINNQHILTSSPDDDDDDDNSETPEITPERESVKIINEKETGNNTEYNLDNKTARPPPRLRRSSSLKSGKTPPGTPGCKKIVRFADVLGLDLADVKTFMDEVPTVPKSAYEDLEVNDQLEAPEPTEYTFEKRLLPMFQQPSGQSNFLDRIRIQNVCLENAIVSDSICLTITGCVRVRNLDFHKSVHLRYTLDGWQSFADFQANYVDKSCDGFSDKFNFTIFGNSLQIGQRLEMAVRFSCKGQQYWDNNFGENYIFNCVPAGEIVMASAENGLKETDKPNLNTQNSWEDAAFY